MAGYAGRGAGASYAYEDDVLQRSADHDDNDELDEFVQHSIRDVLQRASSQDGGVGHSGQQQQQQYQQRPHPHYGDDDGDDDGYDDDGPYDGAHADGATDHHRSHAEASSAAFADVIAMADSAHAAGRSRPPSAHLHPPSQPTLLQQQRSLGRVSATGRTSASGQAQHPPQPAAAAVRRPSGGAPAPPAAAARPPALRRASSSSGKEDATARASTDSAAAAGPLGASSGGGGVSTSMLDVPGQPEASLRLHKARLRGLEDELARANRALLDREKQLAEALREVKDLRAQAAGWARDKKALEGQLDRARKAAADAEAAARSTEAQARELSRADSKADRERRAAEAEVRSRDVRLARALEEVERYKALLGDVRAQEREAKGSAAADSSRLLGENRRLERQRGELITAFKKQLKLIEVLKRQKVHLEAARALQFSEEEFLKTLEMGAA